MDERDLNELRRDPSPEFARALRQRLGASEATETMPRRTPPLGVWLAAAAAMAVVAGIILSPSVRASAQAFLDLFRVRQFTAVSFDPSRLERFRQQGEDNPMLGFAHTENLQDPGPAVPYANVGAAAGPAGFAARTPGFVPAGYTADSVFVTGHGAARLTVDAKKLRDLLTALDIRDLTVPDSYDGKTATVTMTPIVVQRFRHDQKTVLVTQGASPEVEVPAGVDPKLLGAIGLRILGVSPADARRLANTIDWRNTLVVPVPTDAGSFREVSVHGQKALLVTMVGEGKDGRRREGAVVMWAEADRVYAIQGPLGGEELLQMAESVR
jgi:hypothetical protein